MRIAFFVTCIGDTMAPEVGISTVGLLEKLGHEVEFPENQTCCGQLHFNSGYQSDALALARRFVRTFRNTELVVAPSASCVAMVRHFYPYLADQASDASLAANVEDLAPRVVELTEFLVGRVGLEQMTFRSADRARVTYHPTCHSLRSLHLGDGPLQLLRADRGLDLVALPRADECCGFGGMFSMKNADTSNAILDDKIDAILESGAQVVTAVDTSCLMQIGGALSRRGIDVRTRHIAEVLAGDVV